jgi:hypothetical protein
VVKEQCKHRALPKTHLNGQKSGLKRAQEALGRIHCAVNCAFAGPANPPLPIPVDGEITAFSTLKSQENRV